MSQNLESTEAKTAAPSPEESLVPAENHENPPNVSERNWLGYVRIVMGIFLALSFVVLMVIIPNMIFGMLDLLDISDVVDSPANETETALVSVTHELHTFDRVALVGSLQVGLGMYLGFIVTFFGIAMTWLGIEEAFSIAARAKNAVGIEGRLTFSSAGPGLLFAVLGIALIWGSLYKEIKYSETGRHTYPVRNVGGSNEPNTDNSRDMDDSHAAELPGQPNS